jgi:hypothetical protein
MPEHHTPRHDEDGEAYIGYFNRTYMLSFLWDGVLGHHIQVGREMGEPIEWTFQPDTAALAVQPPMVLHAFRDACEKWIERSWLDVGDEDRIAALVAVADYDADDIEPIGHTENAYRAGSEEWLVLTDTEAQTLVEERIWEDVWSFSADFLADLTGLPIAVYLALQPQADSDTAITAIQRLITSTCGRTRFIDKALKTNHGRGHFLNRYDGNEHEHITDDHDLYLYRTN